MGWCGGSGRTRSGVEGALRWFPVPGCCLGGAGQQPTCLLQDPLPKLKDLAFLKDQLESLQRRVEDEVHAGVGQVTRFPRRCGDPCVSGRTSHPS